MSPCLVQQLFRQKIGKDLDVNLFDEFLFPLLRPRKHYPKELLLDIKLTQSSNKYGQSAILMYPMSNEDDIPAWMPQNISPFELQDSRPENHGRNTSKMRRERHHPVRWGSIDILNELRELTHPQVAYHLTRNSQGELKHPHLGYRPLCNPQDQNGDPFEDAFIRIEEKPQMSGRWGFPKTHLVVAQEAAIDVKFLNDFLEDALDTDKRLSWGGDPNVPNSFEKILSTYY